MPTVNCHWSCFEWLSQSSSSPGKAYEQQVKASFHLRKCKGENIFIRFQNTQSRGQPLMFIEYFSYTWYMTWLLTLLTVSVVGFVIYPFYKPTNWAFLGQGQASSTWETELDECGSYLRCCRGVWDLPSRNTRLINPPCGGVFSVAIMGYHMLGTLQRQAQWFWSKVSDPHLAESWDRASYPQQATGMWVCDFWSLSLFLEVNGRPCLMTLSKPGHVTEPPPPNTVSELGLHLPHTTQW